MFFGFRKSSFGDSMGSIKMSTKDQSIPEKPTHRITLPRIKRFYQNDDKIVQTRARNPRFYFVHADAKPRFLIKKGHQKSGIPCALVQTMLTFQTIRQNYQQQIKFMLPKRRFWKPEKHFGPPVWALFQGCEYSFWATLTWKCAQKDGPKYFSGF